MASEIHVDDVGTKFLATIKDDGVVVDISTASSITMKFRKPDDEVIQTVLFKQTVLMDKLIILRYLIWMKQDITSFKRS